ncbi:hypothetical protein N8J89_30120 [Crossiella sp. CA-258035]|uniref:hypothetical protein n=1 Tax=Crossiella sp. CA-258035 TaxID=2981138 RepID=UPI0024BD17D1|nr:hypothetical protein [Crossiella sp. CA-258035]WHT17361.1 hypothetical protein N8J89_30120 [Crossiella sp. CA-258035]
MRNLGTAASEPVRVRLSLPEWVIARGGNGTRCAQQGRVAECSVSGALAPGAQVTVRISLHVSVFSPGGEVSGTVSAGDVRAPVAPVRVGSRFGS